MFFLAELVTLTQQLAKFWKRVQRLAKEKYGVDQVPTDLFNKVWILPETASVYEHQQTVYVVNSRLKVMLDSDYENMMGRVIDGDEDRAASNEVIRELILPEIEKEINTGRNFAPLRQIYHSLILAKWYKQNIKDSILSKVYADQNKVDGITTDAELTDEIYNRYMEAYEKGVFSFIKEDYDAINQTIIPRKYFSGGFVDAANIQVAKTDNAAMITVEGNPFQATVTIDSSSISPVDQVINTIENEAVRLVVEDKRRLIEEHFTENAVNVKTITYGYTLNIGESESEEASEYDVSPYSIPVVEKIFIGDQTIEEADLEDQDTRDKDGFGGIVGITVKHEFLGLELNMPKAYRFVQLLTEENVEEKLAELDDATLDQNFVQQYVSLPEWAQKAVPMQEAEEIFKTEGQLKIAERSKMQTKIQVYEEFTPFEDKGDQSRGLYKKGERKRQRVVIRHYLGEKILKEEQSGPWVRIYVPGSII